MVAFSVISLLVGLLLLIYNKRLGIFFFNKPFILEDGIFNSRQTVLIIGSILTIIGLGLLLISF